MKSTVATLALFALAAFAQSLTINTPTNVVACQPNLLSWTGGTPPYFLSILPGGSPSGSALETLPQQNGTSYTWTCNISPGSFIGFTLRDNTGLVAQTAPVTVLPGTSTSCVNITGAPGPISSSSIAGSTVATAATTTTPGASASSGGASGTSAPASTSTSTAKSNGASANAIQLGVAGLVGVAAAAAFFL